MSRYIDNCLTEFYSDSVNTITLNWRVLTRTSLCLSSIFAGVISDKPCLAWRDPARINQFVKLEADIVSGRASDHYFYYSWSISEGTYTIPPST